MVAEKSESKPTDTQPWGGNRRWAGCHRAGTGDFRGLAMIYL